MRKVSLNARTVLLKLDQRKPAWMQAHTASSKESQFERRTKIHVAWTHESGLIVDVEISLIGVKKVWMYGACFLDRGKSLWV